MDKRMDEEKMAELDQARDQALAVRDQAARAYYHPEGPFNRFQAWDALEKAGAAYDRAQAACAEEHNSRERIPENHDA